MLALLSNSALWLPLTARMIEAPTALLWALVQPGGGASGGAGVAARPEFLPVTGEPASESAASRMLVGGIALLAMLCLAAGAWRRKEAR